MGERKMTPEREAEILAQMTEQARSATEYMLRRDAGSSQPARDGETMTDRCVHCGIEMDRATPRVFRSCRDCWDKRHPLARDGDTLTIGGIEHRFRDDGMMERRWVDTGGAVSAWVPTLYTSVAPKDAEAYAAFVRRRAQTLRHDNGEALSDERVAEMHRLARANPYIFFADYVLELCDTVAALRAELADARADARRVALIQEYCFARNISWRGLIDELAARAASGEDANGQK